jgi:hypothetical protein
VPNSLGEEGKIPFPDNMAAAFEGMQMWDNAIDAARQALKIRPDFQLARNNLAWSEEQKRKAKANSQAKTIDKLILNSSSSGGLNLRCRLRAAESNDGCAHLRIGVVAE